MGAKTRLQNGLLLAIIILLALNLLLPVRYTFKLVKLEPVTEGIMVNPSREPDLEVSIVADEPAVNRDGGGTNRRGKAPWQHRREPVAELEKRDAVNVEEKQNLATSHRQHGGGKPEGRPVFIEKRMSFNKGAEVKETNPSKDKVVSYEWFEEKTFPPDPFHMESKRDYRQEDKKKSQRINFHDPSQRMAYYKNLRKKLVGGGPNMRSLQEKRSQHRMELVREMWDDWFENDNQHTSEYTL